MMRTTSTLCLKPSCEHLLASPHIMVPPWGSPGVPLPLPPGASVGPLVHCRSGSKSDHKFSNKGRGELFYCGYIYLPSIYVVRRLAGDFAYRQPGAVNSVCTSPPHSRRVRVCVCVRRVLRDLVALRRPLEHIVQDPAPNVEGVRALEVDKAACGDDESMLL